MKIVFFGTPYYVLPVLKTLHKQYTNKRGETDIVAVVTRDPKPVGREKEITYSAVDKWAHSHRTNTFYTSKDLLKSAEKYDLGILASYGEIVSQEVIDLFKYGILVIHPSLLPEYRGASPVQKTIWDGKTETGVTILKMDAQMDHGQIITQFKEDLTSTDTYEVLRDRLFERSAEVLIQTLPHYLNGKIKPKTQDESKATYTKMISRQDGLVDLKKDDPAEIERKFRALMPWPGIWTRTNEKRLKILKCHLENNELILDEVQLEGKTPVSWELFKKSYSQYKI